MVFSSLFFLFVFLPAVLLLYYITPRRYRNFVLFISSLFFYAWGEPVYILLMLFSTAANYTLGLLLGRCREKNSNARPVLIVSIFINIGLLCFFKYFDFLLQTINSLLGTSLASPDLALPLGISFYTFQAISYIIDVYRGAVPAQRKFIVFGTYIALFPQLIAGPIVRYHMVAEQLVGRVEGLEIFGEGVRRFVVGLGKKVLLANNIGLIMAANSANPAFRSDHFNSLAGNYRFCPADLF
jgi:alginate O-acetyltransferase complex protein AlgI